MKRWMFAVMLLALVVALLLTTPYAAYSEDRNAHTQDLLKWTRYYEAKMGLEHHDVVFGNLPDDWCGAVFTSGKFDGVWITYEPSWRCRHTWTARDTALHETCHIRMAHLFRQLTHRQQHAEVNKCMKYYR